MIEAISKIKGLKITLKIFADKLNRADRLKFVSYNTYLGDFIPLLFIKKISTTIVIPTQGSDDDLLAHMKSNTRNEIRKAIREGCTFEELQDIPLFVNYYNSFAEEKGLALIDNDHCYKYGESLKIFAVKKDDDIFSAHANLVDKQTKRSMLLYSASIRLTDNINRSAVGNANRFLHFKELAWFRDYGIESYDFGGIYTGEKDTAQIGIASFKRSFGGEEKKSISVYSIPYYLLLLFKRLLP